MCVCVCVCVYIYITLCGEKKPFFDSYKVFLVFPYEFSVLFESPCGLVEILLITSHDFLTINSKNPSRL